MLLRGEKDPNYILLAGKRQLKSSRRLPELIEFHGIQTRSPALARVFRIVERAARSDARVLLRGETGTGKELLAHAIHAASPRAGKAFVGVNIAAVPDSLLEAEFFGVAAGAYTGAERKGRDGKFRVADGGTLFLDEIGDMPGAMQGKILRTLQERVVQPIGGRPVRLDVRIIAATHRDLAAHVRDGQFRQDLFYRLNVVPIVVPTLRDRREDIPLLVKHFLRVHAEEQGLKSKQVSPEAMDVFMQYEWPGNIRELRNLIERLMIMVPGPVIEAAHASVALQVRPQMSAAHSAAGAQPANALLTRPYDSLRDARNAFEKEFIARKLREHHWNISRTAEDLKIERSHLHRKIKLLDVEMRPEM